MSMIVSKGRSRLLTPAEIPDLSGIYARADGANTGGFSFRNKLINGIGLNLIDQRGLGTQTINPGASGFVFDRWIVSNGTNAPITVSFIRFGGDGLHRLKIEAATAPTSGNVNIVQRIESVHALAGKRVAFSYEVNSTDNTLAFAPYVGLVYGTGGSATVTTSLMPWPLHPGGAGYIRHVGFADIPYATGTLGANDHTLLAIQVPLRTTIPFHLRRIQLEEGGVVTPFEERPLALELMMCQRYFFKGYVGAGFTVRNYSAGAANINLVVPWPVTMRVPPAISYVWSLGGVAQAGAITAVAPTVEAGRFQQNGVPAGSYLYVDTIQASAEL
jgi:hypothetical protein